MGAEIFNLSDYRQPPPKDPRLALIELGIDSVKLTARKAAIQWLKTFHPEEWKRASSKQRALAVSILMEIMLDTPLTALRTTTEAVRTQT